MSSKVCASCGCASHTCGSQYSLDYQHEIEELKSKVKDQKNVIKNLEASISNQHDTSLEEIERLKNELVRQRDRYDRLYDSHKKQCKLNSLLEDKLTSSAEKFIQERDDLTSQIASLTQMKASLENKLSVLEEENKLLQRDCAIAVNLLQTNPSDFRIQQWSSIPSVLQKRLAASSSASEADRYAKQTQSDSVNLHGYMTAASGALGLTICPGALTADNGGISDRRSEGIRVDRLASVLGHTNNNAFQSFNSRVQCSQCTHVQDYTEATTQTSTMMTSHTSNADSFTNRKPDSSRVFSSSKTGRIVDI